MHANGERKHTQWAMLEMCSIPTATTGKWAKAHEQRGELLGYIAKSAGAATLLDVTRYEDYDADKLVDAFLNQKHVKVCVGRAGA